MRWDWLFAATLFGSALGAAPATAQAPHAIPAPVRGLHERAAQSDVVALAVVESVADGRIAVASRAVLRGEAPLRFVLKRSPLRPPPLAAGDRALLFLRGDRAPFLLVDEPDELVRIASDEDEASWRAEIPALLAAGSDLAAVARVYARWIDAGAGPLREAAALSFMSAIQARPELAIERAEAALAPGRPSEVRRIHAALAAQSAPGAHHLVERLAGDASLDDPVVVEIALRAAVSWRAPKAEALVARVLASKNPALRELAEHLGRRVAARPTPQAAPLHN